MKKLGYIFLCLAVLWSCQDNADYPFKGKDAVYFQLQTDDYYWTQTLDSMVYTFAGKGVEEDTLWVRVNLQGDAVPYARDILVVTDDEKTTAEEGLHYEALKPVYELRCRLYEDSRNYLQQGRGIGKETGDDSPCLEIF